MKTLKSMAILTLCLLLVVISLAGQVRSSNIQLLAHDGFEVKYAKIEENGGVPNLQYRVVNTSGARISKMSLELTAYNAKGYLLGRTRWEIGINLSPESSANGSLVIRSRFASAKRVDLSFIPHLASSLVASDDDDEKRRCLRSFCEDCERSRKTLCGDAGVDSYDCQIGDPCKCDFECAQPRPE